MNFHWDTQIDTAVPVYVAVANFTGDSIVLKLAYASGGIKPRVERSETRG